ncbi:predicted protein [Naegleria gruberi]|uniref:Predicted protein n=1 Tax=Naegleria gruberi TaxID=5762 RepID=D2V317_NAEGR|nr:uncharacterized protein NAEGRDRAFT_63194 [Naegleria gruberi]EFC48552.1 predicted protein [Naegleria gruberi]|eukprot:XP_002681296.1 predicted protein [Naegleria gruberi strain NEG-M]
MVDETREKNQSTVMNSNVVLNIPINLVIHPLVSKPSYIIKEASIGVQVQYFERFLHAHFASILFKKFNESMDLFTKDQLVIHGKHIEAPRKTLSYSDSNIVYSYSGMQRSSIPWFPELLKLKTLIQEKTGEVFNYALVNVYDNGNDYIGWHSDKTKDLVENSSIVSLTLGETRPFQFKPSEGKQKNSDKSIITKYLPNGSMIIMNWNTQFYYKHCLPKRKNISKQRINITFRHVKV